MAYALLRVPRGGLDLETFSRLTGLHPDLVRRLVVLGLLDPVSGPTDEMRFAASQVAAAARLNRLRASFSLNYSALGLVTELLDRIADLEAALAAHRRTLGGQPWT